MERPSKKHLKQLVTNFTFEELHSKYKDLLNKLDSGKITNGETKELVEYLLSLTFESNEAVHKQDEVIEMVKITNSQLVKFIESEGLFERFSKFAAKDIAKLSKEPESRKLNLILVKK